MIELVSIIAIVFGILQIVLFFKIWGMTNDVKNILNVLNSKDNRDAKLPSKAIVKGVEGEVAVLKMGLIILFGLVTIAGVLYYLYDMHNQKKIERGY